jgi:hypothetical protein
VVITLELSLLRGNTIVSHLVYLDDDAVVEMAREDLEALGIKPENFDIKVDCSNDNAL